MNLFYQINGDTNSLLMKCAPPLLKVGGNRRLWPLKRTCVHVTLHLPQRLCYNWLVS